MSLREAVRLHGVYTAGRYDFWCLCGPAKASVRAHIMSELLGGKRVPQSQAGITVLRDALLAAAANAITPGCIAHQEDQYQAWARKMLEVKQP